MGRTEWVLLLVLSAIWAGAFLCYKLLDEAGLPPFTIVLGRVGIGAAVLLAFVYASGRRMPGSPRVWWAFLVLGALNNLIPFALIVYAETTIDSGIAAIFNATAPIFAVMLTPFFARDEGLSAAKVAGVVLGLAGVVLLMGPHALHRFDLTSIAQLASVGAAFAYACAGIYGRRFATLGISPTITATGQLCGSTILTIPLALLEHPWHGAPVLAPATLWVMLALAVPGTALAFVLYFRILAAAGATNAMLVTFLVPVGAVLLGSVVLGEHLNWTSAAGMALIFLGLAAINGRLGARRLKLLRP